jgi:serine/threonine-protein kinase
VLRADEDVMAASMGGDGSSEGLLGAGIVFMRVSPAPQQGGAGGARSSGSVDPMQSRILALVDGRRSVADVLRLSPFAQDKTLQALRDLCERGALTQRPQSASAAPRGGVVVIDARPRAPTPGQGVVGLRPSAERSSGVVVIDTRQRDRDARASRPEGTPAPVAQAPVAPAASASARSAGTSGLAVDLQTSMSAGGVPSLYRLGDYEVAARIGQGGMGSVYVCRKAGAGGAQRLLSLKVVRQYSSQYELAEASLRREARLGPYLRHPNIHSVVDSGTYKDQPFIVLDYVEGVSLSDLLAGGRRPPAAVVVSIVLDVLRALEKTHAARDERGNPLGMVHCDVSPPNILVGADGSSRLTDFGSCRIGVEEGASRPDPLKLGKPSYMAPEQLFAEPIDSRTDLFALGAVMYGALTGQDLFAADSYEGVVLNVLKKRIPRASEHGAPACLDDICKRALSRARDGRFSSATEMAAALVAAASPEGVLASPAEVAAYLQREHGEVLDERRRRIQLALAGGTSPRVSSWDLNSAGSTPSTAADKKPAPTLFIPGADDEGEPAETKPTRAVGRSGAQSAAPGPRSAIWAWIAQERQVIALSVVVGVVIVVVTVVWSQGSAPARKLGPTATRPALSSSKALPPHP